MTQRTTMRRWLRKGLAALCALACAAGVAACGSGGSDDGDVIKVGIKFDQPGLGFKKSGTYEGFDVDVARYIANQLGSTDS
ncbi:MAG: ABC transporter substrate-binding protein, partial [Bifidobacterium choerinum]